MTKKGLNTHTHTHTIQRRSATRLHCCISVCVRRPWQSDRSSHTRTQHKCTVTHVQIQGQDHIHTYTIHTCAHMHISTHSEKEMQKCSERRAQTDHVQHRRHNTDPKTHKHQNNVCQITRIHHFSIDISLQNAGDQRSRCQQCSTLCWIWV